MALFLTNVLQSIEKLENLPKKVKPDSLKLFFYELRCSFTYSNHFYGLEIDVNVHTRAYLEQSVRDITLERGSEG